MTESLLGRPAEALRRSSHRLTKTLLGLYAKLVAGLAKHGISAAEARQNAAQALPVAATATIRIPADSPGLEELLITLINDALPEAQAAGARVPSAAKASTILRVPRAISASRCRPYGTLAYATHPGCRKF